LPLLASPDELNRILRQTTTSFVLRFDSRASPNGTPFAPFGIPGRVQSNSPPNDNVVCAKVRFSRFTKSNKRTAYEHLNRQTNNHQIQLKYGRIRAPRLT